MPSYAKLTMLDAQDPRPFMLGKKKEAPRRLTKGEIEEERKRVRQTLFEQISDSPQAAFPRGAESVTKATEKACDVLERDIKAAQALAAPYKPSCASYAYITPEVAATLGYALGNLIDNYRLTEVERRARLDYALAEGLYICSDARKNPTATLEVMYKILGTRAAVAQHEIQANYPRGTRFEITDSAPSYRAAAYSAKLIRDF